MLSRLAIVTILISIAGLIARGSAAHAGDSVDFEREVAPLLIRRCVECHKGATPGGGLRLDSRDGLLHGGDSGDVMGRRTGSPSYKEEISEHGDDSMLLHRVEQGEMPPAKQGLPQPLPEAEVVVLRAWIEAGAEFPEGRTLDLYEQTTDVRGGRDWWSFQPLQNVEPPLSTATVGAVIHPIDAFIRAELQERDMSPAPRAEPDVLMRRLHWTTTGLPPSAEAVTSFTQQSADDPHAADALIDELLASPHFGERWARHWLDVVRFAETSGYERDQTKPFAWKYRDWVVNAFNSDMPYDKFVIEQLAGDEVAWRSEQSVIGTGFLMLGTWNDEPNDPEDYQYERLEDLVHATSSAFLGLTTKCARCHDHKFDPIPQADYYRIAAAFWPGPIGQRERELVGGPTKDELGFAEVLGWTDITRTPTPLHALKNGERDKPLDAYIAASMTCVPSQFREFTPAATDVRTNGLRLQLAEWIASAENPLTARVIVNRLWQHHFGTGLVRSSNNFGFTGDKPTHPELLDWLANELIRSGWSLKHVHRLILTSQTWQQSSVHPMQDSFAETDAANHWLWRANRRRRDAESLRDAILDATGELDLKVGGPSFHPTVSEDALEGLSRKSEAWQTSPPEEQLRRSLYMFTQRSLMPPMMTTFDMCDSTLPCGQRDVTIVAPQALALLNNAFVHDRAAVVAELAAADADVVGSLWRRVLKRDPSVEERELAERHVVEQTARFASGADAAESGSAVPARREPSREAVASLALVLFNSNAFAFVD